MSGMQMVKFATAKPARLQVNALLILNKQRKWRGNNRFTWLMKILEEQKK